MDFSAVCRTCLGTNSLTPIFPKNVDHKQRLTAIFAGTGIKIQLNDGLPQQICTDCINSIFKCLSFHKQCKESETTLRQLSPHSFQNDKLSKNNIYENSKIVEDLKSDILKIDLKCEYEFDQNTESIQSESDSDLENEIPLSCLTDTNKENEEKSEANHLDEGKSTEVTAEMQIEEENEESQYAKNKVQRVSCPVCQKDLSSRSLGAHLRVKHGGLRCGHCKTECSSKEALDAHAATCPHKRKRRVCESSKELVTCEVCHKPMQRASLRMHQAVKHKGLGPVCEHCGRRFGNKLRLSEHLRAKHDYEKLRCGLCEFQSSSRAALENHERRHRGEKPFVCETCGAKFHAAYLLAQHRHSHRTDKRVKCSLCGAAFKAANSLHAHRLARHGARRHHCPLCARAYSCRHYAVKHMRAVHGYKGTVPPLRVDPAPF